MKPLKVRQVPTASSHEIKSARRSLFSRTNMESTLRFASVFILAVAACEFSGTSDAILKAYSRVIATSPRRGDDEVRSTNTISTGVTSLHNLYPGTDEYTSVDDYLNENLPNTYANHRKPSFQLEMHWVENAPVDKVCRIHNACILDDGSVLVHQWMKSQEQQLRLCGADKIVYMQSEQDFEQSEPDSRIDLFGAAAARYHIPHFLTDILPMIYASELLRPRFTPKENIKSICEGPNMNRCSKRSLSEQLFPSIFVDDRVGTMMLSSWVPQLVALLPGKPYMHVPERMFLNDTSKVCFRSVISYRKKVEQAGREWLDEKNPMFHENGITKKSTREKREGGVDVGSKKCELKVTILNRVGWVKRSGILLGRDIVNLEEVCRKIDESARKKENENLNVQVNVEYFENSTFAQQVDVMQKADVLVGVHGAGLGNLMFARVDTAILEVFPFSYYAGPFDQVASTLGLHYEHIVAQPDSVNFIKCLEQFAMRLRSDRILAQGRQLWEEALRKREAEGDVYHLRTHAFVEKNLSPVKQCARAQRMTVDAEETAEKVIEMAQWVCNQN